MSPLEISPWLVLDRDARILAADASLSNILGRASKTLISLNLAAFVHPDDAHIFFRHLRLCRSLPHQPVISRLRLRAAKAQKSRWYELLSTCAFLPGGPAFRTALLELEADRLSALTGELAQEIFNHLEHSIALLDWSGSLLWCNRAFAHLLHLRPEKCIGSSIHQNSAINWISDELSGRINKLVAGDRTVDTFILEGKRADGGQLLTLVATVRKMKRGCPAEHCLLLDLQNVTARLEIETERKSLVESLMRFSQSLEEKVQERTINLTDAHDQLKRASAALIQTQEAERRRLACELHDQIGQSLTGLRLLLGEVARQATPGQDIFLHEARQELESLSAQVRAISIDLRPQVLDDLGLAAALEWHATQFSKRSQIPVHVCIDSKISERIGGDATITFFRVVQEALNNAAKHARATRVTLNLAISRGDAVLSVRDNGRGFEPREGRKSLTTGLSGMRERVQLLGGTFSVKSAIGKGTTISCAIPLKK